MHGARQRDAGRMHGCLEVEQAQAAISGCFIYGAGRFCSYSSRNHQTLSDIVTMVSFCATCQQQQVLETLKQWRQCDCTPEMTSSACHVVHMCESPDLHVPLDCTPCLQSSKNASAI